VRSPAFRWQTGQKRLHTSGADFQENKYTHAMATNYKRLGLLAIFPIVLGILVILAEMIWASYRIRSTWPLTTGTVASSNTVTGKGKYGQMTYGVSLIIEYVKGGRPFVGKAQTYVWTSDYQEHLENLQRCPAGTKVLIRCNPSDSADLRLSPDLVEEISKPAVFGVLVLGTALGVLLVRTLRARGVLAQHL
jgi:Protein of unknown function (DUF3592)